VSWLHRAFARIISVDFLKGSLNWSTRKWQRKKKARKLISKYEKQLDER